MATSTSYINIFLTEYNINDYRTSFKNHLITNVNPSHHKTKHGPQHELEM